MARVMLVALFAALSIAGALPAQTSPQVPSALARQVVAAESAFAETMASRDSAAFATFIAPDAVFFGEKSVMRGKPAVVEGWRPLFAGASAPFSWRPETVEVLDSGTLALSSGPVLDPQGRRIGTFTSIWRRGTDGAWRVVFDKGAPFCEGGRGT